MTGTDAQQGPDRELLGGAPHDLLPAHVDVVVEALARVGGTSGPRSAIAAEELRSRVEAIEICPDAGLGMQAALHEVEEVVLAHGVRVGDPSCAAHLQCPPLAAAAAAELAIGATNQSMDSFEQAPAATFVEDHLVRWCAGLLGLGPDPSGVMTAGGTASNLLGLRLARDRAARCTGHDVDSHGLPAEARGWTIVTSAAAHDSVHRAAALLGLGRDAVLPVEVDRAGRMDLGALDGALARLDSAGARTIAIVATAGTTDLGGIDPLGAIAPRARVRGAWLHVDAAVGSALALSERLRGRLAGIEAADSVTVDFHKLWWQPLSASALLVGESASLDALRRPTDYLDRDDDEGVLNLVSRSLDTSRRFDALKLLISLRTVGRRGMAEMVERVVRLTELAAESISARAALELVAPPSTAMVCFRLAQGVGPADADGRDALHRAVQRSLFDSGRAIVGRTRIGGAVVLKLTLVDPRTRPEDLDRLLDDVVEEAERLGPPVAR